MCTDSTHYNSEERATRQELAALYRAAFHYGWTDLTSTHISARLTHDPEHYLLNSYALMFDEIKASNLIKMRLDGLYDNDDESLNLAGHLIHSSVLNARSDINFVIHSHTRAGVAVSAMSGGLLPLSQHAGFVLGTLSSHPYQDSTAVKDEGALLAQDLGNNFAMLLENHGLLVVGRTASEAFIYHYYLEMACKIQVDILCSSRPPIYITEGAMQPLYDWGNPENGPHGDIQWKALIRMLDRKYPDYRN